MGKVCEGGSEDRCENKQDGSEKRVPVLEPGDWKNCHTDVSLPLGKDCRERGRELCRQSFTCEFDGEAVPLTCTTAETPEVSYYLRDRV